MQLWRPRNVRVLIKVTKYAQHKESGQSCRQSHAKVAHSTVTAAFWCWKELTTGDVFGTLSALPAGLLDRSRRKGSKLRVPAQFSRPDPQTQIGDMGMYHIRVQDQSGIWTVNPEGSLSPYPRLQKCVKQLACWALFRDSAVRAFPELHLEGQMLGLFVLNVRTGTSAQTLGCIHFEGTRTSIGLTCYCPAAIQAPICTSAVTCLS